MNVGVDNVNTLGVGLALAGVGSGRIPHVSVRAQCLRGLECSSSPTSGTCFPCSGACEPLSVHKLFTDGPLRGPFFVGGRFCSRVAPFLDFRQR